MRKTIEGFLRGQSLSRNEAAEAMNNLLVESTPPEQIAAFLIALRAKGETAEEIAGFVECLRKRAVRVPGEQEFIDAGTMDVCGTGGDSSGTFNLSTTSAFVLAGAGVKIAKHGNRSVSSKSGSFDVIEALGLRFETDPSEAAKSLRNHGLALLFAQAFHPDLKKLATIRRNLGVYSVFNALGPLLNPIRVRRQLIGVYRKDLVPKIAQVLALLDGNFKSSVPHEVMVVHGMDGLDELSLSAPTYMAHLKNGVITEREITPESFGLQRAPREALLGGDAATNADLLIRILQGEKGPRRDWVLMNCAAAITVSGLAKDFNEGVMYAEQSIDSGKAMAVMMAMKAK